MTDSNVPSVMTLDQFEERILDGDRWVELVNGRFLQLTPPDDVHGDVVRNLSRVIATYLKKSPDVSASFELPLILQQDPPIVRSPAVAFFRVDSGNRFAETDKVMSDNRPYLVIEVASSNDRRESMANRVRGYLDWGVTAVWVIDPVTHHVHLFHQQEREQMLKEPQSISGQSVLPGFSIAVADLFRQPEWAKRRPEAT